MVTSQRRLHANRRNAQRSTGPKTSLGKRAAAGNALKHGLSIPVAFDGVLPEPWEGFAGQLADGRADLLELARTAAQARFNLKRHNAANVLLLGQAMATLEADGAVYADEGAEARALVEVAPELVKRDAYARRQRSVWKRALAELDRAKFQAGIGETNPTSD
jgi:hypothetical protein